jgi:hypothetical protein
VWFVSGAKAQARDPVAGSWKLISVESRTADGTLVPEPNPVGGMRPTGLVIFDGAGHVSLQMMPAGRPGTLNTLQPLTPDESKTVLFGYVAYFGSYTVDLSTRTIHIEFQGAINPSMVGTTGERTYEVDGRRMIFHAGRTRLEWERLN